MKDSVISAPALAAELEKTGAVVPDGTIDGLCEYVGMLMRWNRIMNLTGASDWREAARDLVADCLRLAAFIPTLGLAASPETWDLGAGAGLPGIPLRLAWTDGEYHLVDKRAKRTMFLSQVIGTLKIPRTHVFCGDARDFFARRKGADCVVSRAFMPWESLLGFVAPHVRPGGLVVFMANEGPKPLPAGWASAAHLDYPACRGRRWLWAVRREEG